VIIVCAPAHPAPNAPRTSDVSSTHDRALETRAPRDFPQEQYMKLPLWRRRREEELEEEIQSHLQMAIRVNTGINRNRGSTRIIRVDPRIQPVSGR
jgi:hypothetical protein